VSDDQVTIDPDFVRSTETAPRPSVSWRAVLVLVVGAGLVGWWVASWLVTSSTEPNVPISSVAYDPESTPPVSSDDPPESDTVSMTTPLANISDQLSDVVPGFTDSIVMLAMSSNRVDVVGWAPSESGVQSMLSIERETVSEGRDVPVGLDASGSWFAQIRTDGALAVYPIAVSRGGLPEPTLIDIGVMTALWHDTVAGSMAWIACTPAEPGSATLFTASAVVSAAPAPLRAFADGCKGPDNRVSLMAWNEKGALVRITSQGDARYAVVGSDGSETDFGSIEPAPVVSFRGQLVSEVPTLGDQEYLADAKWSPDGSIVAIELHQYWGDKHPRLRVVDVESNRILTEYSEADAQIKATAWSEDSQFLLYLTWNLHSRTGSLAFYDTSQNTTVRIPVTEVIDEIRTTSRP
jgi:hypothetical protein